MAAVLTINMKDKEGDKDNKKFAHLRTLMVLNIETQKYEPHMEEEKDVFTQNTVPFDFDEEYIIWLRYEPLGVRQLFAYSIDRMKKDTILQFDKNQGIVSHFCMVRVNKKQQD